MSVENVVLLDDDGKPIGTMKKSQVHGPKTPLHLAFSVLIFDERGNILLTRRAINKRTWPGVWTGSCCGHPQPHEPLEAAIARRVPQELGCSFKNLICIEPTFRYKAVSAEGIVENEVCPVYTATIEGTLCPNSDEVAEYRWCRISDIKAAAKHASFLLSPWFVRQVLLLSD